MPRTLRPGTGPLPASYVLVPGSYGPGTGREAGQPTGQLAGQLADQLAGQLASQLAGPEGQMLDETVWERSPRAAKQ